MVGSVHKYSLFTNNEQILIVNSKGRLILALSPKI